MGAVCRIYPIYFNPRITRKEGRKIGYNPYGAIPTTHQISKILKDLAIAHRVEHKEHPKHTYSLVARFVSGKTKTDEVERMHTTTGGCIVVEGPANKKELIRDIFNIFAK